MHSHTHMRTHTTAICGVIFHSIYFLHKYVKNLEQTIFPFFLNETAFFTKEPDVSVSTIITYIARSWCDISPATEHNTSVTFYS